MARFSIYSGSILVGYSALEQGDPSMGVAFGAFEPAAGYRLIHSECRTNHRDQSALLLSVQTEEGLVIECSGVAILDYSEKDFEDVIEVNVLGISSPPYEALFPQHLSR
ncbi:MULTISPECIES: hypothetical protein [unclassified Pseudomonas]|uniref:hypothetical protein n=1 Tax=unclassified Pseudomonas TaxID=196821 RepID=UPI0021DB4BC9|nr:hypothetical protein [Pseudomonas sp. YeP6b]